MEHPKSISTQLRSRTTTVTMYLESTMQLHMNFVFTDLAQPPVVLKCQTFYNRGWEHGIDDQIEYSVEKAEDCLSLCKSKDKQIYHFTWITPQYGNVNVTKKCLCYNKGNSDRWESIIGVTSCFGKFCN